MNSIPELSFDRTWRPFRRFGLLAGLAGLALAAVGLLVDARQFFQGYLVAYVFWVGFPLGCLGLLMLHHLVAGAWGAVAQRLLEAGALTIIGMALLFLPVILGMHALYPWTHEEVVAGDAQLMHKQAYLNLPFFIGRSLLYFILWSAAAVWLGRWSGRLDETGEARYVTRMRRFSAGGLIAHVLLVTFAGVDWIMSLDPHWYSSIFGWLLVVSQTLSALALCVIVLRRAARSEPLASVVGEKHFHDYGNLMLAFVILWTYMMFAQYLIIWSGNIPEEVSWYVQRQTGAWGWITPLLIFFHFAVPFAILLFRHAKRSASALSSVALGLLAAHALYVAWLMIPSFHEVDIHTYWIAAASFAGIGGLWVAAFSALLAGRPVLVRRDPRFASLLKSHKQI